MSAALGLGLSGAGGLGFALLGSGGLALGLLGSGGLAGTGSLGYYLRLIGGALICIAALGVCRLLRLWTEKRREQSAALVAFVDGLRCHISNTGCSIDGFMAREDVPLLSELGLYREYGRLGDLGAAFRAIGGGLDLPRDVLDGVCELFRGISRLGLEDVLARLSGGVDALRADAKGRSESDERLLRTVSVYAAAIGAGLMIILI